MPSCDRLTGRTFILYEFQVNKWIKAHLFCNINDGHNRTMQREAVNVKDLCQWFSEMITTA